MIDSLSVILPTLGRPAQTVRLIEAIHADLGQRPHECIVVAGDDATFEACEATDATCIYGGATAIEAWNIGAVLARYDWLFPLADDVVMLPGWLAECDRVAAFGGGFIGLNEGVQADTVGHYIMSREFCMAHLGGVVAIPCYRSWWNDQEISRLAQRAGRYRLTAGVVMRHDHHTLGRSPDDATYQRARQWHAADGETFKARQQAGFPVEWEPAMRPVIRETTGVNGAMIHG